MEKEESDKGSYRYFFCPISSFDYATQCTPAAKIVAMPIQ